MTFTPKQAHIGLKVPCKNCPFTINKQDSIKGLQKGRRESIIKNLVNGITPTFQCHKTTRNGTDIKNAQACAGAMAVTKQHGGIAIIEAMSIYHGIIDSHYFDDAMNLSTDNFELSE